MDDVNSLEGESAASYRRQLLGVYEKTFSLKFWGFVVFIVVISTAAYAYKSVDVDKTLTFLAAAIVAGASTFSAFLMHKNLSLMIDIHTAEEDHRERLQGREDNFHKNEIDFQKRKHALRLLSQWHGKDFQEAREVIRSACKESDGQLRKQIIVENEVEVTQVLNYLESLASATKHDAADEDILFDQFKGVVITIWELTEDWVNEDRETGRNQAFCDTEDLYLVWKKRDNNSS